MICDFIQSFECYAWKYGTCKRTAVLQMEDIMLVSLKRNKKIYIMLKVIHCELIPEPK